MSPGLDKQGRKLLEREEEPRLGAPQIPPELDSLDSVGGGGR